MNRLLIKLAIPLLTAISFNAYASTGDEYSEQLVLLETKLLSASQEFAMHNPGVNDKSIDERLADGIVMQASGDHQRASYIFMDILARNDWKTLPQYQTARLQIAKSLYEDRYYRLSQQHLIELLQSGTGNERTEGVSLLLQVAQKTGDWTLVNQALADVTDFSKQPSYLYIMGRAMFLQGDYELARKCLEALRTSDEWQIKANYLIGVLDTISGNYPSAISRFEYVSKSIIPFRGSDQVHELAILAMARLHYEQGEWSPAIDNYQKITETSRYFPTALYEMAWTHLRAKDYQMAQQNFELLLLSFPNDSHAIETRRLLADIKRELGMYDEAVATYQTLVNEFEPIMENMEHEADNLRAHKEQLREHIESEQYENVELLPDRARGIVAVGNDVGQVEQMLSDLDMTNANTSESELLIAEISAALEDEARIRNLPEFQRYANAIDDILVEAILMACDFTEDYSGSIPEAFESIQILNTLPRSNVEREIMISLQNAASEERLGQLHRLKLQIENLQHKIQVLRSWIASGKTDSMLEDEKNELNRKIETLEQKIQLLQEKQNDINTQLAKLRNSTGIQQKKRNEYMEHTHKLVSLLEQKWKQDEADGTANGEYYALIQRERSLFTDIRTFNQTFEEGVQARAQELKTRLEREITFLNAEKGRYTDMKSNVGQTAGNISLHYWETVYEQIRDLVLNADLGMVDIAWLIKDAKSKAITATLEEKSKESDVLKQDFKQFLKESGQEKDNPNENIIENANAITENENSGQEKDDTAQADE